MILCNRCKSVKCRFSGWLNRTRLLPLNSLMSFSPHSGHLREGHLPKPEELRADAGRDGHLPVQGGRLPHSGLPGLPVRVSPDWTRPPQNPGSTAVETGKKKSNEDA